MKKGISASTLVLALLAAALPAAAQPFNGWTVFTRNGGMYFQAASAASGQPASAGTWEAWINLTAAPSANDCGSLIGKGYLTSYWIGICAEGTPPTLRSYTRGTASSFTSGQIPVGTWTHVAVTTDGATRRHYLNGILAGSQADGGAPTPSTNPVRIGSDANWNFQPPVLVDEVRIWNVARTANEIKSTMWAPVASNATGLLDVWHFDGNGTDGTGAANLTGSGATAFGTTDTGTRTFFVPVVLKNQYSSEITFTNRGTTTATVTMQYTATSGGGSGTAASFTLAPGRQRVEADAIDFLSLQGLPIDGSGTRLGTLRVTFSGLSSNEAAAVTVRTATDTANPAGRAGLSYAGVPVEKTFVSAVYLPWLRFGTSTVRTNLALQNAGAAGDGNVTLRVTLYNATGGTFSILPDVTLAPGGFRQLSSQDMGLPEGYSGSAKVEVVGGSASFYAYAVQNDQVNSDGSFILPMKPINATPVTLTIPSVVEAGTFRTEFVVYNAGDVARNAVATLVCPACSAAARAGFVVPAKGQYTQSDFIGFLRSTGVALPNPLGVAAVTITPASGSDSTLLLTAIARTSSLVPGQGAFGVAYPAVRAGQASPYTTWISAAQQNATNRTNLAVLNLGDLDSGAASFHVDVYDGVTGALAASVDDPRLQGIPAGGFVQVNSFLSAFAPGVPNAYVKVTRTGGVNEFAAYLVVNDGGNPGERTGDGAYVAMDVPYR